MNEHDRRESGHLMLITPDRVFYAGLLGRPRQRCPGAFYVYVSIEGGLWLTTADGRESYGELAVVPAVVAVMPAIVGCGGVHGSPSGRMRTCFRNSTGPVPRQSVATSGLCRTRLRESDLR